MDTPTNQQIIPTPGVDWFDIELNADQPESIPSCRDNDATGLPGGQSRDRHPGRHGLKRIVAIHHPPGRTGAGNPMDPWTTLTGSEDRAGDVYCHVFGKAHDLRHLSASTAGSTDKICVCLRLDDVCDLDLPLIRSTARLPYPHRVLILDRLKDSIKPENLPLDGISWVVIGGRVRDSKGIGWPLDVDWVRGIIAECTKRGIPVFVVRLGSSPVEKGVRLALTDPRGEDITEWPEDLRVRQFPEAFKSPRLEGADGARDDGDSSAVVQDEPGENPEDTREVTPGGPSPTDGRKAVGPRRGRSSSRGGARKRNVEPVVQADETSPGGTVPLSPVEIVDEEEATGDKAKFDKLHEIVCKWFQDGLEAGRALREIKRRRLWKAGGYKSWAEYTERSFGRDRSYCHRLIQSAETVLLLEQSRDRSNDTTLPLPTREAQVRPLYKLDNEGAKISAWKKACEAAGDGNVPTAKLVEDAVAATLPHEGSQAAPVSPRRTVRVALDALDALADAVARKDGEAVMRSAEKLLETIGRGPKTEALVA